MAVQALGRPACLHASTSSHQLRRSAQPPAQPMQPVHRTQYCPSTVCCAQRGRRQWDFSDDSTSVTNIVEEATASSNGFFNDNFKSALSNTLSRQGQEVLLQGQERVVDENHLSDQEDVLKAAIMASKATLLKLQLVKSEAEKAIEIETKQVERLQFALQKARNDAAYYRSLANMQLASERGDVGGPMFSDD